MITLQDFEIKVEAVSRFAERAFDKRSASQIVGRAQVMLGACRAEGATPEIVREILIGMRTWCFASISLDALGWFDNQLFDLIGWLESPEEQEHTRQMIASLTADLEAAR